VNQAESDSSLGMRDGRAVALGALGRVEEEVRAYDEFLNRFGQASDSTSKGQVAEALKGKAAALRGALSDRLRHGRVLVVSGFVDGDVPKTKDAVAVLTGALGALGRPVLVVAHRDDEITWKSLRNVPAVHVLAEDQLNTYDVLASDHVVFTEQALTAFVARARATKDRETAQ